ncbi:MAG: S-layer homology domain-containing protein [Chloroflexi bacterium]|nr:S-layer homology domain-containing protein [Chloroflexota bacterium]
MRLLRLFLCFTHLFPAKPSISAKLRTIFCFALIGSAAVLPYGGSREVLAAREPTGSGSGSQAPLVTGADYTLKGANYVGDAPDTREKSFDGTLTLPAGGREATYMSDPTRAPIDFTDVAPHWWADTPGGTTVQVELRTSPDGTVWAPWEQVDEEADIMAQDPITETFGSPVSVNQVERTHKYVQSRVTLRTDKVGITPILHELTYTFINAGITPNPPKPQAMAQGTPSEIPMPLIVSRKDWGSPQGESSPKWTPKYKRVTNIIIHHTATSNKDTDFAARVRAIWYYHTNTRGWGDIGYNYLIDPNGVIYEGRAGGQDVEAGHAYPFNSNSMGIGMIGNYMTVAPSAAAQASLIDLISWKANQRGIDPLGTGTFTGYTDCGGTVTYTRPNIAGHRDFKGTACGQGFNTSTCPGDKLWSMLPQIRAAVVSEQPAQRAMFTQHDTPGNIAPGATVDVHLTVRNSGSEAWPKTGPGAVTLGYKWLTPDNKAVNGGWQEIRTNLPTPVAFADTITVTAKLNAPKASGHYALIWDMYREGMGWFADQGSPALRVDVVVGKGVGDKAAPTSSVLPLPVYSNNPEIDVRWTGQDESGGSGLVSYDVQYRTIPNGQWTDWKMATSQTQAALDGDNGYTYEFRSRARDAAGNVEEWPDKADAYTSIDTSPPALAIDTPVNGAHVQPGDLIVRGRTEPGIFVAVNNQRADEAAGVFTSTVQASGRDFVIHVTAADPAGNVSRLEITVQAAARYNDVSMSRPDFLAIESLSDEGVISGYSDGSFRPDSTLTRAQLAKMLAIAFQWGLIKPAEGRFSDVPGDSWMFPYVETAAARGAMEGYSDGTFGPTDPISRGEVARSIVLAAGWQISSTHTGFSDVPADSSLAGYVATAHAHGIVTGDEEGNFYPSALATRGEVSTIFYSLMQALHPPAPAKPKDDQPQPSSQGQQ